MSRKPKAQDSEGVDEDLVRSDDCNGGGYALPRSDKQRSDCPRFAAERHTKNGLLGRIGGALDAISRTSWEGSRHLEYVAEESQRCFRLRAVSYKLAERVGFEPTLPFRVNTLSKRAPSATRPSLRLGEPHSIEWEATCGSDRQEPTAVTVYASFNSIGRQREWQPQVEERRDASLLSP